MVSKQESLTKGVSLEFACKEKCQVGCTSQPYAFVEMPSYQRIPRKPCLADVFSAKQNSGNKKLEAQCVRVPGNICSFTSAMGTVCEDMGGPEPMKRHAFDSFPQYPYKRARQADCCWQLSEFSPPRTVHLEPLLSARGSDESRGGEDCFHLEPSGNTSASMSSLPLVSCNFVRKEHNPVSKYASPNYTVDRDRSSRPGQLDDDSWSIFDYYHRKHVAVGPDHQAEIPTWRPRSPRRPTKGSAPGAVFQQMTEEDNNEKFIGRCIVPMSEVMKAAPDDPAAHPSEFVVCGCPDEGSIRCVKQHVDEAREKFKRTIGLTTFAELGFYDMGEYVAQKWTEQEELLFLKVVASNPASLGRNFWNDLPLVFPSRSSNELVSYYFNVFMLRKRAEQNRFDPTHVDSDDDEWQESEEEVGSEVYESDSVVETPGYLDDDSHDEVDDDEDGEDADDDPEKDDYGEDGGIEEHPGIPMSQMMMERESDYLPRVPCCEVNAQSEDLDIQDDSCTSYEVHHMGVSAAAPDHPATGTGKDRVGGGGRSGGAMDSGGGCFAGPDARAWDRSYFSARKDVDFLPTCHVIEEVLGKESAADDESDA